MCAPKITPVSCSVWTFTGAKNADTCSCPGSKGFRKASLHVIPLRRFAGFSKKAFKATGSAVERSISTLMWCNLFCARDFAAVAFGFAFAFTAVALAFAAGFWPEAGAVWDPFFPMTTTAIRVSSEKWTFSHLTVMLRMLSMSVGFCVFCAFVLFGSLAWLAPCNCKVKVKHVTRRQLDTHQCHHNASWSWVWIGFWLITDRLHLAVVEMPVCLALQTLLRCSCYWFSARVTATPVCTLILAWFCQHGVLLRSWR